MVVKGGVDVSEACDAHQILPGSSWRLFRRPRRTSNGWLTIHSPKMLVQKFQNTAKPLAPAEKRSSSTNSSQCLTISPSPPINTANHLPLPPRIPQCLLGATTLGKHINSHAHFNLTSTSPLTSLSLSLYLHPVFIITHQKCSPSKPSSSSPSPPPQPQPKAPPPSAK